MDTYDQPRSMGSPIDLCATIDAAVTAAHAGAAILQSYAHHRADLVIDRKARNDLASQADREAEAAIIQELRARTPQFGIVAEETGGQAQGSATWYIDPLDGTTISCMTSPLRGFHRIDRARRHIGVCRPAAERGHAGGWRGLRPRREELFTAVYGLGAWLNGRRISCSRTQTLDDAVLATGFPFRDFSFAGQYMPMLHDAINRARGVRMGAAALDLAWTACGRYDGYWEMGLAPWDVAAGTLLVRESGGMCSDMHKRDSWPIGGRVVAGNAAIGQAPA